MNRERLVSRDLNPLLAGLPSKFAEIADYQIPVIAEIVEHFDSGAQVVVLDAPTGSGKTLIAECTRRMLKVNAAYVCSSKHLQNQFLGDFPYSRVLYGRANYIPNDLPPLLEATCEDCGGDTCHLCKPRASCPYLRARAYAREADVAVVNSALWLSAMNNPGHWLTKRDLTVFDEADTLEGVLMSQAEIYISARAQQRYGLAPPDKMTVQSSYHDWAEDALHTLAAQRRTIRKVNTDINAARRHRRLTALITGVSMLLDDLEEGEPWIYTGGAGSARRFGEAVAFKPIRVARLGRSRIWPNVNRCLLMSATVISARARLEALGYDGDFAEVRMDSQFPAAHRQIIVKPTALMTRSGQNETSHTMLMDTIRKLLIQYAGDRILIHTVSYHLADLIANALSSTTRAVFNYQEVTGKELALEKFLATPGAVLVAPSMDRGVDLPGDACRVQIVAKTPLPNLGDKQVAERMRTGGDGNVWYAMQTAASFMQMVGRAVRSPDDWAVCYVLDSYFVGWRRAWGHLFPGWFSKAIRVER